MKDLKKLTREQLEDQVRQLDRELQMSIKIESKLAQKLAKKEHELAILSVRFEDAAQGLEKMKKIYESKAKAE